MSEIVPVTADEYAEIERQFAELVGTRQDLVVVQGEAALSLEAAAKSLGGPGVRALNVVTGPYGAVFGDWLRDAGAEVDDVVVPFDRAATVELVAEALDRLGTIDLVGIVHAEAATGSVNPLREIAAAAHERGALVVVDAVASIGADPLAIDEWGLDLVVLAAQKALDGPTGAAAVVVGEQAWERIERNPAAPRRSVLSLLDWRERWVLPGRRVLPVIPHHVEMRLLGEALRRALEEGLAAIVARHGEARDACRSGVRALGLEPWIRDDAQATAVATTVRVPDDVDPASLVDPSSRLVTPAPGSLSSEAVRVNHTGRHATPADVESALAALRRGLVAGGRRGR